MVLVYLALRISRNMARICASSVTEAVVYLSEAAIQRVLILWSILRIRTKGIDEGVLRFLKCHIQQIMLIYLILYELRVGTVLYSRLI